MLYRALVRFMSLVARTFYKRIEVVGLANVPADGAVILAGNHPNALIDGVLLMCHAGRTPVHFLGNAKLWKIPSARPAAGCARRRARAAPRGTRPRRG